ncbi:MAG: PAS domain-containing protein, partial [Caldisericia bacterium]|nr:PAS domain-containing protein [Caldisericia bacterium]
VSYIKEESEGILYGMSLAENLTEIETAKQNVELIKKQFEYALEGSRAGSWDWYIDIDQLYVNNRWLEIFGFQEHQIATLGYASKMDFWGSRIHPKDAAFYKSELKNHLSKKTDYYRCEYRVLHKNGTWIWIEDRGKITQTSALGKPSRMSGTIQDISYQHDIYQDLEIRNSISSAFVEYPGYSVFSEVLRVILGITGNTKGVIGYFEEDQTCCIAAMSENLWEGDVYPFPIRLPYEDWKRTLWGKLLINGEEKPLGVYKITPLEGCKSLLQSIVIPIHYNDVMVGFFIVGDVSEKYTSNDFNIAQTIAKRMSPLFYPRLQFILNEERRYVAEQNLKASEEKLEMALDASNIGSWDWRMDTNTLLFDTRFMRILGYTEDAFKEQSITRWNQIVHPKDLDKDEGDIQKHFLGLKPYHGVDVQMKHRNGSWIWVTKRGKFTDFDSDGKPIQMNGTITEITHVKKAQLEAKAQKDELEWLVTGHQELLTKITAESLFQYIAATLSKKIPQSLILVLQASTDKKILHIKDFSTSSKTVKQTIAKWLVPHLSRYDIPITEDYQPIFSTQTLFEIPKSLWVQSMGFFSRTISQLFQNVLGMKKMYMIGLTGNKGQMGSVIVIQLDNAPLQNSKTIESFVYKASLVLERIMLETEEKASKVRLEQVTEQSKSIIWETDTDGRISYISSYVKELLGYAPEELIQWISWYDLHTQNERSTMKELFEKKLQQGESFKNVFTELKKKDGTILYVSSNAVPIVTNDTIVGFRGADYDITLLKNMDQAKNEFINTVSHEMRTPLTVVKEANMILEMEALTSQQRKVLDISKKNIDRLSRIINDVLDYQKL